MFGIKIQGKVDAKAEIEKLEKKLALSISSKEKLQKLMDQPNYQTSVREEVRATNTEKVCPSHALAYHQMEKNDTEIETLRQAIGRFQSLL